MIFSFSKKALKFCKFTAKSGRTEFYLLPQVFILWIYFACKKKDTRECNAPPKTQGINLFFYASYFFVQPKGWLMLCCLYEDLSRALSNHEIVLV